eukprot:scaffold14375_cov24-Tisochrysis_lutea.AAC.1
MLATQSSVETRGRTRCAASKASAANSKSPRLLCPIPARTRLKGPTFGIGARLTIGHRGAGGGVPEGRAGAPAEEAGESGAGAKGGVGRQAAAARGGCGRDRARARGGREGGAGGRGTEERRERGALKA